MKELREIVAAWDGLCRAGGEAVLATVVGVSGSTYRRPGARMLLAAGTRLAGSVSGGCLESDLAQKAWWQTRNGPTLVTYDSMDAEEDVVWGFGLGCNGVVQVLLERVSPAAPGPLELLKSVLDKRQAGVMATIIGREGAPLAEIGQRLLLFPDCVVECGFGDERLAAWVEADARQIHSAGPSCTRRYACAGGSVEVFLEWVSPPLSLVIFGTGHDAPPLARLAAELGWHVTVVETRGVQAAVERFPCADSVIACLPETAGEYVPLTAQTAALVMTHHYSDDRRVLETLFASPTGYIGLLGPAKRAERLLAEISDDGFAITDEHRGRLHSPVGLDIGADNPEEIALSVVAEIQAARAARSGLPLRNRREPLHNRPPQSVSLPQSAGNQRACPLSA